MKAKMFEVRDRATCMPVMAVQLGSDNDQESWLLAKLGFGVNRGDHKRYVVLCRLTEGDERIAVDWGDWPEHPRTIIQAHKYIQHHFDELEPGAVVDVEFILGESSEPKVSDRDYGDVLSKGVSTKKPF